MQTSIFIEKTKKSFGPKIKALRLDKGYTLKNISEIFEKKYDFYLSPNMLGKIERNTSEIRIPHFLAICDFYKVEITYFLEKAGSEFSPSLDICNQILGNETGRKVIEQIGKCKDEKWKLEIIYKFLIYLIPSMEEVLIHHSKQELDSSISLKAAKK